MGDIINLHCRGYVMLDEVYEREKEGDDEFGYAVNYGANGVVVDGKIGKGINELKMINHSCEPTIVMQELFVNGKWNICVFALIDIPADTELLHDFHLSTEDEELSKIQCQCQAEGCRGFLYEFREW